MKIRGRTIEEGPCFVVAEIGLNHQGQMDTARALINAAAQAGARPLADGRSVNAEVTSRNLTIRIAERLLRVGDILRARFT